MTLNFEQLKNQVFNGNTSKMRISNLRKILRKQKIDALVLQDVKDILYLTCFVDELDSDNAHVLLITKDKAILFTDSRYYNAIKSKNKKFGQQLKIVCASKKNISVFESCANFLNKMKNKKIKVALQNSFNAQIYLFFKKKLKTQKLKLVESPVKKLRAVKPTVEINFLKEVQKRSDFALKKFISDFHLGKTEIEYAKQLDSLLQVNCPGLAFETILASGPNSANPHARPSTRPVQVGDILLIDFGAKNIYNSDCTRCFCVGEPSEEQKQVYDAVLKAHNKVKASIKEGYPANKAHNLALKVMKKCGYKNLMGHSLGHGVGLDIHEAPNLSPFNKKKLKSGNVVTVEPGIYLPGKFGIRIEDTGVITGEGFESFTTLSHELAQI
ncbi:MAG: Xaa-Pro peptidase family protein [Coriobacteriales bacterium]|nr:Xaa-Pro peptidase family protein [Coriobacteriales bacterium]